MEERRRPKKDRKWKTKGHREESEETRNAIRGKRGGNDRRWKDKWQKKLTDQIRKSDRRRSEHHQSEETGNTTSALQITLIKHHKRDENEPRGKKSQRKLPPLWFKLIKALITLSLACKKQGGYCMWLMSWKSSFHAQKWKEEKQEMHATLLYKD